MPHCYVKMASGAGTLIQSCSPSWESWKLGWVVPFASRTPPSVAGMEKKTT